MNTQNTPQNNHQNGELKTTDNHAILNPISAETFDGKIHIEWDPDAEVTPLGQLPFFIQYLKTGGLFEPWVDDCPLHYSSNNAPRQSWGQTIMGSGLSLPHFQLYQV